MTVPVAGGDSDQGGGFHDKLGDGFIAITGACLGPVLRVEFGESPSYVFLRESGSSVLEIKKFGVFSFVSIPVSSPTTNLFIFCVVAVYALTVGLLKHDAVSPVRAEIDVKLGGIRCNVMISTLKKLLRLKPSGTGATKKEVVLQEETSTIEKPQSTEPKAIMWKCTLSVPEITIVLYSICDAPLYQGSLQSSYVLASDISSTGPTVHTELGELHLRVADENQECLKESISSATSNSGSLLHVAKVTLDWGKKDMESSEDGGTRCKLVLYAGVAGMGIYFTYKHVESLIVTAMFIKAVLKNPSAGKKTTQSRPSRSSKPSGKGTRLLKFTLKQCSVSFCGDTCLENTLVVADPKRVNYGSQGGRVVISVSEDGTQRTATEKQSTEVELERVRSIYEDHLEEDKPDKKVTLFDMQNAKFVQRSVGHKEVTVCSLFSATDISITWEPDMHLSFIELGLKLKALVRNQKVKASGNEHADNISSEREVEQTKEVIGVESGHVNKPKKKESIFAVDVEVLSIYAEAGDGVDAFVQVQSIFSENARIGVLLEVLLLGFNGAQILKSGRMQIFRIPNVSSSSDATIPVVTVWDIVIQALDVYACLPFRLELRAIDDVVEEMLRALKIVANAKTHLFLPMKKDNPNLKPKKPSSNKFGCIQYNGAEIDMQDPSSIQKMQEEIYRQSFQSYYLACQKLTPAEGSGSWREGLQAGFKPSTSRISLFSISGTELDVTVTLIDGGTDGMIEVIKQLDSVCRELDIPFSRVYGCNLLLNAGSLAVQIRDYPFPLFSAISGRCEGRLVMGQQATAFQPQMSHDVFIGRWRKVRMLRSATVFADVSYAFTVALRRANLSKKGPGLPVLPKKEKSLPWWDDMRNYIHGNNNLFVSKTKWYIQASADPYEKLDMLQIVSGPLEIQQSDGRIYACAKNFKIFLSSLESLIDSRSVKIPTIVSAPFLDVPAFSIEVLMDWDCDSGHPLNHYLFALPVEGKSREKVFDPFRSTALTLRFDVSLKPLLNEPHCKAENVSIASPTVNFNVQDLAWLAKFGNVVALPPCKIRLFARFKRFGIPLIPRSGNLPLDRVMTETMFRLDITPTCIKYKTFAEDDPAKGLTFTTTKFKVEVCSSRGKQKFTFECMREPLGLVYLGLDLHLLKAFLDKADSTSVIKVGQTSQQKGNSTSDCKEKHPDEGYFVSFDYFTIRKQFPIADPESLSAWQEAGRKNLGTTYVRSDDCQRIFLYGLKILLNIENRDAVRSFGAGLAKAVEPQKPCASRQYAQRKLLEEKQKLSEPDMPQEDALKSPSSNNVVPSSSQNMETSASDSFVSQAAGMENSSAVATEKKNDKVDDSEEEGTRHFMVNVIEPQFNLHSEEANGRFLFAAASGRVLARSFHSVLRVGSEVIEQALGTESAHIPEGGHDMTLTRMEFSVMLEHVQAHVAPTDVDLGAGIQWLPKIRRGSQKVKRTGALLETVFMPCDMYFRFTRHKSGTPELKVKPLKDLSFNSQSITMSMTSRQFQVMLDVLTNLLFARAPKPRKSCFTCPGEDDEDEGEEADAVVPSGVEEVELAKIALEKKEWEHKKEATAALRVTMQKAAQQRLMEKEKNKSPSCAMRVSVHTTKVAWSMLMDGKPFAEVEINDLIYDYDRDYKDIGVALFTTKSIFKRNCLPNAKSDTLLSAWNPPPEWGKKVLLRVEAKQGAPRDGNSVLEFLQVDVYPLKIHLTEAMYRMVWGYLFPSEDQDSQKRKEVWKVSTIAGARRAKKSMDVTAAVSQALKESEGSHKSRPSITDLPTDSNKASKLPDLKPGTHLRRTSSVDRMEDAVAESIATELLMQAQSSKTDLLEDTRSAKSGQPIDEKKLRPPKLIEFRNIKISQVELSITYEGSRFVVSDLKLLMDTFHRVEFTGTWRRLISRVKKHVIWGVLKSVTGMQPTTTAAPDGEFHLLDNDQDQKGAFPKRSADGAGDGFVTSVRGLFNNQRRKAKQFVLRTMRGEEEGDQQGQLSDGDAEISPFARQLTITKAKKLIKRHTKKFEKGSISGSVDLDKEQNPSSPMNSTNPTAYESDSSSGSELIEELNRIQK
ncbi:Protein KINKY POLLEN [Hibiscus syriacus]|uniref:Protein KINKY POLLEN n=1 Tax=Hibiscus syriacus TaxID=106335 RepID=A0A6A2YS37_HIBSY|nr:Protein KINKY POLLEN [Hibiscus syriacus]